REFNIGEGTVSSILHEKDKWLSIDSDMPKLSLKKQQPPA
ncbi:162_t:CDS:1, partial [Ambispora gerdemannii]